jgi:Winged helix DNA-binding domain
VVERAVTSDVVAFRLNAHNLSERVRENALLEAAGQCGVQNSPPGSALLALHARVERITPALMERAVAEDKILLQTWSLRGAPFYFPTEDASVFTTGVLPTGEEARRHFIPGVEQALDVLDMSLAEAVELSGADIRAVLSGRRLAINELGAELAERIAGGLPRRQRKAWEGPGPYAANQPLGEGVVHFCLRVLTLQGVVCLATRTGNKAPFVLLDEWLGHPLPDSDRDVARAELLRRYLHCYGPTTRKDFARWLGVFAGDVDPWWRLVEDEMTAVEFGGRAWILTEDLGALRSSLTPNGVRLLPPRDPYTQMRDRETIADKRYHREVWKSVGDPGALMTNGKITGIWRARKSGQTLAMIIKTFSSLREKERKSIQDEAEQVALLRGAASVGVEFDTY